MKLRATITIDTEAKDFQEAAEIQKQLDELCQELSQKHTKVTFDIRERRAVKGRADGQGGARSKKQSNQRLGGGGAYGQGSKTKSQASSTQTQVNGGA